MKFGGDNFYLKACMSFSNVHNMALTTRGSHIRTTLVAVKVRRNSPAFKIAQGAVVAAEGAPAAPRIN